MVKNRYITAMEIGLENEANGITYERLLEELQKRMGYEFSKNAECTFIKWFIENFSPSSNIGDNRFNMYKNYAVQYVKHKHGERIDVSNARSNLRDVLFTLCFLNGDAAKKYIDYLELVESRESSRKAIRKANQSIWIAIIAIGLSMLFSILNILSQPKQPYDVNVLNHPEPINKKEMDSLKNELYKAELLIAIYEGDSINEYGKVIKK